VEQGDWVFLDEAGCRGERRVPRHSCVRAERDALVATLASLVLCSFDERSTQALPRQRRRHRQLLEVADAIHLEHLHESSDFAIDVDGEQEAGLGESRDPGRSWRPHVDVKEIKQQLVRVVLNPLDSMRVACLGESDQS